MKTLRHSKQSKSEKSRSHPEITAQYSRFKAFIMAFYSKACYLDVLRSWRGIGLTYLLLMLAILCLPYSIMNMIKIYQVAEAHLIEPLEKLPSFAVRDGRVYFYEKMPYLVKNDKGEVISIIDTTGKINHLPQLKYPMASILVTSKAMHSNLQVLDFILQRDFSKGHEKAIEFTQLGHNLNFNAKAYLDELHVNTGLKIVIAGVYPAMIFLFLINFILIFIPLAMIGQIVSNYFLHIKISFKQASRLMLVAITPTTVLFFIMLTWFKINTIIRIIGLGLMLFYFFFGLYQYKKAQQIVLSD